MNIKNREVEWLAGEVAGLANETKTEAIRRRDLAERQEQLQLGRSQQSKRERVETWLRARRLAADSCGSSRAPLSKEEEEEILGSWV